MATVLVSRRNIHLEWGDCDPAGIVYFPRYFEYFDACTAGLFEHAGMLKPDLLRRYRIAGIPVVDVKARFITPSSFGDEVVVESSIVKWGNSSFVVRHALMKAEALAVECHETRVWVARSEKGKLEARTIPEEVKEKFTVR
jgi:4-hydroxybenzoyl-CoA thioesterase